MAVTGEISPQLDQLALMEQFGTEFSTPKFPTWQSELAAAVRTIHELCERLEIALPSGFLPAVRHFPVLVPESFLKRMEPGNPHDPLLRQVLPSPEEFTQKEGFTNDPVGDLNAELAPGLLQKYQGRALLVVTGTCAVHCRYCFRKEYPYEAAPKSIAQWQPAIDAIHADRSLREVILSGGDPLILNDQRLGQLIQQLAEIPHLRRLRIHSRLPVVLPSRITATLLDSLNACRLQPIMVVHANHPQELENDCGAALQKIVRSGIPVLNQAVLLKGVNDDIETLTELCENCINLGIIPYYLHQLDRVTGTSHFEVDVSLGQRLMAELRDRLPGYAIPRYVHEVAGATSKLPLDLITV